MRQVPASGLCHRVPGPTAETSMHEMRVARRHHRDAGSNGGMVIAAWRRPQGRDFALNEGADAMCIGDEVAVLLSGGFSLSTARSNSASGMLATRSAVLRWRSERPASSAASSLDLGTAPSRGLSVRAPGEGSTSCSNSPQRRIAGAVPYHLCQFGRSCLFEGVGHLLDRHLSDALGIGDRLWMQAELLFCPFPKTTTHLASSASPVTAFRFTIGVRPDRGLRASALS